MNAIVSTPHLHVGQSLLHSRNVLPCLTCWQCMALQTFRQLYQRAKGVLCCEWRDDVRGLFAAWTACGVVVMLLCAALSYRVGRCCPDGDQPAATAPHELSHLWCVVDIVSQLPCGASDRDLFCLGMVKFIYKCSTNDASMLHQ
jgi:hypothetical protein